MAENGKRKREETTDETPIAKRQKKIPKRTCMFVCQFLGTGYLGSCWGDKDKLTIEKEIHDAIVKADLIQEKRNIGDMKKLSWSRSSRTDKGVHAASYVFGLKINISDKFENLPEKINNFLPPAVRIVAVKQMTKKFNARNSCSSRLYDYVCPSYLFSPNCYDPEFKMSEELFQKLKDLVEKYLGTHKFHNFTRKKLYTDNDANRYIISMEIEKHIVQNVEYIKFNIHGQSFLYNMIRHMIGNLIGILREKHDANTFDFIFGEDYYNCLLAPAEGLYLHSSDFDRHNVKMKNNSAPEKKIVLETYLPKINEFIIDFILPEIHKKQEVFTEWAKGIDEDFKFQKKDASVVKASCQKYKKKSDAKLKKKHEHWKKERKKGWKQHNDKKEKGTAVKQVAPKIETNKKEVDEN